MQEPSPLRAIDELYVLTVPATTADGAAIEKLLRSCGLACRVLPDVAMLCAALRNEFGGHAVKKAE